MNKNIDLNFILKQFNAQTEIKNYGNGHINDTYLTHLNESPRYILQRINTNVFKDPAAVMNNIENVTDFLREKIIKANGDPERETMTVIKTSDGKNYYKFDDDNYFRMYSFVEKTVTIEQVERPEDMYNAGKGFGKFQALLDDFPAEKLSETIVDFHNTAKRLENLKKAIEEDKAGRVKDVQEEIEFALSRADMTRVVIDGIENGDIPLRVTHNDTKINNILFDEVDKTAVCVIDLDTVMPGSALYDFGDALRAGATTAAEDETDLDKVEFSEEYFTAYAKGYLEEMGSFLTQKEIELLPFSAKLLTFECGIRFLTDYIEGDTYFKIHREHHNLDRARNQFKLVSSIEEKEDYLNKIVKDLIK